MRQDAPRFMGLDVGDKRIGVALTDLMGWTAQPAQTHQVTDPTFEADCIHLANFARERNVVRVVVGLPRNMDGSFGAQAERVREFVRTLEQHVACAVVLWDERLTTSAAQRVMTHNQVKRGKRKQIVDQIAAVYILESYIQAHPVTDDAPKETE